MADPQRDWLLRKGGYFYRPDSAGYTASVHEAGRYTEVEAKRHAAACSGEVKAHHIWEWLTPPDVSEPVDTSAENVERVAAHLDVMRQTGAIHPDDCNYAAALLRALAKERAEQESLLAARNVQNAAAFTASDGYQKRCEQGDALLREARDYVYDYGSEATMAPLVARIDAHLAGEDMGRGT